MRPDAEVAGGLNHALPGLSQQSSTAVPNACLPLAPLRLRLQSGFKVMTAGHVRQGGTWTFAEAFHWSVWTALGGTALLIALLVAIVEFFTYNNGRSSRRGECT